MVSHFSTSSRPAREASTLKLAQENGDGWRVPVAVAEEGPIRHVSEASIVALLRELCVAQPLATFSQKLNLSGSHLKIARKAFVFASGYARAHLPDLQRKRDCSAGAVEHLQTHHFPMLSMPRETAHALHGS